VAIVIVAIVVAAVMIAVPMVIVFHTPAVAVPVPNVIVAALPPGTDPACCRVRDACPIAVMPLIMAARRIPVAFNPNAVWPGSNRSYSHHTRGWRSSDGDADRYLSGTSGDCEEKESR
jgi:hypothetical protein